MMSRKFINILSAAYILVVLIGGIFAFWMIAPVALPETSPANLDKPAESALSLSTDLIKLLITLGTGLITVGIWLLTRPLTDGPELMERAALTMLSLLALCQSLYFGFIALHRTLIMIAWKGFDPRLDLVWWPQVLQYYSFVTGALLLGLACIRSLNALTERHK